MEDLAIIGVCVIYSVIFITQHLCNYWIRKFNVDDTPIPIFAFIGLILSWIVFAVLTLQVINIW